jgi:hypothetical protein
VTTEIGPMNCQQARLSLGVLVLGVIDPEERPALEAHLAGCERCAAELAELAVLPGLLHRLDPVAAAAGLPVPPAGFSQRVVDAARARARRRRLAVAALGTAAAVLVAVSAVLAPRVVGGDEPGSAPASAHAIVVDRTDPTTSVSARVSLVRQASGTQLTLVLGGVGPGERCRLVARDQAGRREVAATWVATYTGQARVTGTTSFPRRSITSLQVVRADGVVLVSMPVTGSRSS